MVLNDPIANVLSAINNAERSGKQECRVKANSKLIQQVLEIMKDHRYVGDAEVLEDGRGGVLKINLLGKVNNCGVVKPRYAVMKGDFEKFEKRYLPAYGMGLLILSTSKGLLTHHEAKKQHIGGRLIAYVY